MEFDESLVALIVDIFPHINNQLEIAMQDLYDEVRAEMLKDKAVLLSHLGDILIKIFQQYDPNFRQINTTSMEFMRNLQQNSRPLLHFLKSYPKAEKLVSGFFKILGKNRDESP